MKKRIELLTGVFTLIAIIGWVPFLAACSNAERDLPLEQPSLSKHDCKERGLAPHLPLGVNKQIKAPVIAGGVIRSGDFLITLYLICDQSLASDDPDFSEYSWQGYSEVRYLGLASGWEILGYHPELASQVIREDLTINDEVIQGNIIGPQTMVSWGMGQGHYSPIMTENQIVARALSAGEPIDIVLTISSSKTLAAVRLQATFEETPDGFHLLSAEIIEEK